MKQRAHFLIACLLVSLIVSGCSKTESAGETKSASSQKGTIKIGVTYCLLSAPAVKVFAEGIRQQAKELGVEIIEVDASWDAQKQTDQMNSFVAQGVDGIILNPVDSKSIIPAAKKAFEAKIPIVMGAMNIDPSGEQYVVSYVGADEADVGRAAGKLMMKHLGSGKHTVAIVEGQAGTDPQIQRTKGFEEAIAGSGIEITAKLPGDFDKAKAMNVTEDLLTAQAGISGIWVHDDTMCVGVVQAIKAMGFEGKNIAVVSYNGSKAGADMVRSGDIVGTAVQPLVEEGKTSLTAVVSAVKGEKVEKWYKDTIIPLTKETIDTYDPTLLW